jgi:hypothetical protein
LLNEIESPVQRSLREKRWCHHRKTKVEETLNENRMNPRARLKKQMILTARPWKQAVARGIWRIRDFRHANSRNAWWPMTRRTPANLCNANAIVLNTNKMLMRNFRDDICTASRKHGIVRLSFDWLRRVRCEVHASKAKSKLKSN